MIDDFIMESDESFLGVSVVTVLQKKLTIGNDTEKIVKKERRKSKARRNGSYPGGK